MAKVRGLSFKTVQRIWNLHGLKPHQQRTFKLSQDKRFVEKLTDVDGYDVDLRLEGHLLFFRYSDRPGVVGVVGARLGDAGVNIAGAQVSRNRRGGEALMTLAVDNAVPADVLSGIGAAIGATVVRSASIDTE